MRESFKNRLEKLEAANRPPESAWTIGVEWMCGGRVVARTPPRPLEPGEGFSWQRCIDEITQAHAAMEGIDDCWSETILIDEDDDSELPD